MLNPKGKMWLIFSKWLIFSEYVSKKGNLYSPKLLHSNFPSSILHLGYKEEKAALSECINQKSTGIHLSSARLPCAHFCCKFHIFSLKFRDDCCRPWNHVIST